MGAILRKLALWAMGAFTGLFGSWKSFLTGLLVKVVVAIVLYNLVVDLIEEILQWGTDILQGVQVPGGMGGSLDVGAFSSLGAWFVSTLKVPQELALMVSAISTKFLLRKIPFLRW